MKWTLSFIILLFSFSAWSQVEQKLIRRVAVFPVQAGKLLNKSAEEAWWQVREALTENKRFLVASKNFLNNKSVFQSRGALEPADAIILGRLLDAHVLVTTFVKDRILHMNVYEGQYGRTVWQHEILLHPSLPLDQQIPPAAKKLVLDFIASIPYQGFVTIDELVGKATYKEGDRTLTQANVGANAQVEVGDTVQFVVVKSDGLKPLLGEDMRVEVFAQGTVAQVKRKTIVVEVKRATDIAKINENTLVRLPSEMKRLREKFALEKNLTKNVDPTLLDYKEITLSQKERETKPLVTALSYIGNIALMVLLAF